MTDFSDANYRPSYQAVMAYPTQEPGTVAALNRIARALERLADAQQQIAEQGEPVDEDDLTGQIPFGHLGQRDE